MCLICINHFLMKIAENKGYPINCFPTYLIFTYTDFNVDVSKKNAVVIVLNRMLDAEKIMLLSMEKICTLYKLRYETYKLEAWETNI